MYIQCTVSHDSRAWGTRLRTLSKTLLTIVSSVLCNDRIMRRIYALLWPPMQTFISCQVVITDKCWCHKEWRLFGQILTKLWDQLLWLSSPQVTTLWWISVKGYCKSKNFASILIGEYLELKENTSDMSNIFTLRQTSWWSSKSVKADKELHFRVKLRRRRKPVGNGAVGCNGLPACRSCNAFFHRNFSLEISTSQ